MKRNTRGFYTLEAAIFLPFVLLTVLSLGYFMKVEGTWENCMHGALDESARISSRAYDTNRAALVYGKVKKRINEDNPGLSYGDVKGLMFRYSDGVADEVISYNIQGEMELKLPLGFGRSFDFDGGVKFRGFVGKKIEGMGLGAEGLEHQEAEEPVWIFPDSGKKYHGKGCTYVKASVEKKLLTNVLRSEYSSCGLCDSDSITPGSVVFCFKGEDTAYHRGTCKSINRHTIVIDKKEAVKKGYSSCNKCGGG
ncbi:MAG: hypothetical protein GX663_02905 [Clostridiales bacterium]|nr:hypothetical protein [Clostridiales bacterium]